jgi:uncharacterized protein YodC (DUF2158 family)
MRFKLGDEVQHKSGGPKMIVEKLPWAKTIEGQDFEQGYWCRWWDGKQFQKEQFEEHELQPYDPVQDPNIGHSAISEGEDSIYETEPPI